MINFLWMVMLSGGVIYAGVNGNINIVTQSAINAAENAVVLSFKLMGVMCLWLGIMKIAEVSGMVRGVAKILAPFVRFLFPSIPRNHPALGAIIVTLSANMLGMGNAVTPLGIKAMHELQKLNNNKDTASPAMCTLLALCTAGFTLVPATIIAIRAAAGSVNPAEIVGTTILASFIATCSVIIIDKIMQGLFAGGRK